MFAAPTLISVSRPNKSACLATRAEQTSAERRFPQPASCVGCRSYDDGHKTDRNDQPNSDEGDRYPGTAFNSYLRDF